MLNWQCAFCMTHSDWIGKCNAKMAERFYTKDQADQKMAMDLDSAWLAGGLKMLADCRNRIVNIYWIF